MASVASAQPTLDFKGLPMRATPEAAQEHFHGLRCSETTAGSRRLGTISCINLAQHACRPDTCGPRSLATYGGIALEATQLYFGAEGLQTVILHFKPRDADELIESVTAKFGPPTADDRSAVQNRMGATFDQRTVRWMVGGSQIKVDRYSSTITRGMLSISTPDALAHMKATRPTPDGRTGDM